MTSEQPDNKIEATEILCLKEVLRTSELAIKCQQKASYAMERKATLLVTLCIGMVAYLVSWDICIKQKLIGSIVFIVVILMIAVGIASFVLFSRHYEVSDSNSEYLMQKYIKSNFNEVATDMLGVYKKTFNSNKEALVKKAKILGWSLWFGMLGVSATGLLVFNILNKELYIC